MAQVSAPQAQPDLEQVVKAEDRKHVFHTWCAGENRSAGDCRGQGHVLLKS